jgi:hypothetical protein
MFKFACGHVSDFPKCNNIPTDLSYVHTAVRYLDYRNSTLPVGAGPGCYPELHPARVPVPVGLLERRIPAPHQAEYCCQQPQVSEGGGGMIDSSA